MKSYVQTLNEMYEQDILKENPLIAGIAAGATQHVLNATKPDGQMKQEDSFDSSQTAGAKIDESLREKVKEIISEGVAHMVESNCDEKSPLTYQEGYQHVMEYAQNKLHELSPDTPEI